MLSLPSLSYGLSLNSSNIQRWLGSCASLYRFCDYFVHWPFGHYFRPRIFPPSRQPKQACRIKNWKFCFIIGKPKKKNWGPVWMQRFSSVLLYKSSFSFRFKAERRSFSRKKQAPNGTVPPVPNRPWGTEDQALSGLFSSFFQFFLFSVSFSGFLFSGFLFHFHFFVFRFSVILCLLRGDSNTRKECIMNKVCHGWPNPSVVVTFP